MWALLTDAEAFPRWNSTVTRIGGPIALGRKLAIQVPISERTFTPTVTAFVAEQGMTWSDGFWPMFQGVRTFELTEAEGETTFAMEEVFTGLMLPMIARTLPDFGPPFEQYARDLKRAAEEGA
ncbi:MAG: SRPBCC domain-containing protein [Myxococcales bacterium]|nr:SRPBCC domain-containing protein [Myxococcales bacterium]